EPQAGTLLKDCRSMLCGSAPIQLCARQGWGRELVKFQGRPAADPKREENAEQNLGRASEECSLLAAKRLEECAVGEQRVLRGFFRNQGVRGLSGLRSHDPHFVPVVAEF